MARTKESLVSSFDVLSVAITRFQDDTISQYYLLVAQLKLTKIRTKIYVDK